MFKQITAPEHVLAMQFSDTMTSEDTQQAKTALDTKLQQKHGAMGVLVDLTDLTDMTVDAIATGIKVDLDFLAHIGQFQRMAFVSDKKWPSAAIGILKPLVPRVELKAFKGAQRDDAIGWVGDAPAEVAARGKSETAASGMRLVPTTKDNVMAFEIDGPLTADSVTSVVDRMKTFLDKHDKVRLLGHIKHLGIINPKLITHSGLLSMKLAAMKKVERYAVLGAPGWMNAAVKVLDPITSEMEMKTFADEEEAEAWEWIGAARV